MSPQPTKRERRDAAREARLKSEQEAAARAARTRRLQILAAVAATVIAVVVVIAVVTGGKDSKKPPAKVAGVAKTAAFVKGLHQDGDTLGDPKAPVTLVEYADLQCPICKEYSQQVLPILVKDYVRTGKVRIELKIVSILGPDSTTAQKFAAGVLPQNKLWFFTHLLYENQGEENTGYLNAAYLRKIATATPGLDVNKAFSAQTSAAATKVVQAADNAGIDSTPTFKIGKSGGALEEIDLSSTGPQAIIDSINTLTK